jgi:hypothetical protein
LGLEGRAPGGDGPRPERDEGEADDDHVDQVVTISHEGSAAGGTVTRMPARADTRTRIRSCTHVPTQAPPPTNTITGDEVINKGCETVNNQIQTNLHSEIDCHIHIQKELL